MWLLFLAPCNNWARWPSPPGPREARSRFDIHPKARMLGEGERRCDECAPPPPHGEGHHKNIKEDRPLALHSEASTHSIPFHSFIRDESSTTSLSFSLLSNQSLLCTPHAPYLFFCCTLHLLVISIASLRPHFFIMSTSNAWFQRLDGMSFFHLLISRF